MPRLQPGYTSERAVAVATALIRGTVLLAVESWPGDVYLYGSPDRDHPLFLELARDYHLRLADQGPGAVHQRAYVALCDGIARRGAAAVMCCEVPHCPPEVLEAAHEHLARGHNVIGPCMDGGHYLLGLQQAEPMLFAGEAKADDWLMAQIMVRAEAADQEFEVLPILRDVHTLEDLRAVAQDFPVLRPFLPASDIRRIPIVSRPAGD